jgi:hypothetical protein
MIALDRSRSRDVPIWSMAPGLRRMARRQGGPPPLAPKWPCHQLEDISPDDYVDRLALCASTLEGVEEASPALDVTGRAFALDGAHAKGQPESYVFAAVWLVVRPEGSLHLTLRPEWAQKVVSKGWGTVHPFARYMAGAVPPQSLVIYAPRDSRELAVVVRIIEASHGYATGRIGNIALPDTRW